ncbi:hypothetical protein PL81_22400, partial [Streptomyces sp. RSD-27]
MSATLRLAVSALAVAATAGCMSVGEDAAKPGPSASVGGRGAGGAGAASGSGHGSGIHGNGHGVKDGTGPQGVKSGEP